MKNRDFSNIFAQNMDREAVQTSTHNYVFEKTIKNKCIPL